jgi:protein arginine N-methyltransferase 5
VTSTKVLQALKQELAYAAYLDVHSAILPPPRNRVHVDSYARAINACLNSTHYINISIRLPIYDPSIFHTIRPSANSRFSISAPSQVIPARISGPPRSHETSLSATWEMWDIIRSICDYSPRLTLSELCLLFFTSMTSHVPALDLTPPLPLTLGALSRWAAESVRFLFLPASTFIANNKGYPVLPKGTQSFIRDSMAASIIPLSLSHRFPY